jgi:hypothetical protein
VIYEMATGRKAFEGKSQASLVAAILERDPPPISNVRPLAAPTLDGVVATCLRKKPEDRSAVSLNLFVALYARIAPEPWLPYVFTSPEEEAEAGVL